MNIESFSEYSLSLNGATEDCAFGPDTILFRLCHKIFACINTERSEVAVLKCAPEYAAELRAHYAGISGAWHWNKRHWNDVRFDADVDDGLLRRLVDHAYEEVRKSLPKKTLYNFPDLPDGWRHGHLPVTDTVMERLRQPDPPNGNAPFLLLTTDFQTAGRGQRGTTWEADAEKNLLFGFRFRPAGVKADRQFVLSEITALAVADALSASCGGIRVKWPNDIYYKDSKICGMLIENDLCGDEIAVCVVGIGINVNQEAFAGDAPNPISLRQILGKDTDRAAVLRRFLKAFAGRYDRLRAGEGGKIAAEYLRRLYRGSGTYAYRDKNGAFKAAIESIGEDGRLRLRGTDGRLREYAFKEVSFII